MGCCIWLCFGNPDPLVWYGEKDYNSRLYESLGAAESDHAENIEDVHMTFKWWFGICSINLACTIAIGIPRHCNKRLGASPFVYWFYFFCFAWWLGMWGFGLHFRFKESGRAVCNEGNACDKADSSEPCPDTMLHTDEEDLIQSKSCKFMKYYLDIAGLLIGGYAAWFILGLTGATKTPVWTPKRDDSGIR